jgi:hexosaminidase
MGQPVSNELPLMPWPASITMSSGSIAIDAKFSVAVSGLGAADPRVQLAVQSLYSRLARQTGLPILPPQPGSSSNPTLVITVAAADHAAPQRLGDNEKYSLSIGDGHVTLAAEQPLGVLRGMETLLQLVAENDASAQPMNAGFSVPLVSINDAPRFPWRGLSLDVSRHFIPVDGVKRTIDGLAAVKLNVLHWHLSDDQGFRVESKRYPRLQELGSDGLFYTQDEIRGVVAYAALRGVRIVPEFDMPGHSTSWLVGYPDLASAPGPYEIVRGNGVLTAVMDPTKEATYQFLDGFIGEMVDLFPDEYFHIGGDEVDPKQWNQSPAIQAFMTDHKLADAGALQSYFNQRLLKIVTDHGKRMAGWDEILQRDLPKTIVIQSWRGQESLWKAAREGYSGILSAGYYLDLMYPAANHYAVDPLQLPASKEPAQNGHAEAAGVQGSSIRLAARPCALCASEKNAVADLTPDQAKLILGGEAAMWEELATAENLDAKLWPRLAAIAERFWSPQNITNVASMYQRLAVVNGWLEWLGLTQRSNLELMRRRLAGELPVEPLDRFSAVLEPVKGYVRHSHKYSSLASFNHLVDSIPPESEPARRFQVAVDAYLAEVKSSRSASSENLRYWLTEWSNAARQVRLVLEANSLLADDLPAADGVHTICETGLEALTLLDGAKAVPANWKATKSKLVSQYVNQPVGDLLIQIAPAVAKLVTSVQ